MLLTYTFIFTGAVILAPQYILQFWLLPLLLGQPFLRLFLLAEHAGCPHEPDMLKNSRTTRTNPPYYSFHGTCLITPRITAFQLYHFINYQRFISISQNTQQLQQMDILLFIASTRSAFLMKNSVLIRYHLLINNTAPMLHKNRVQKRGPSQKEADLLWLISHKNFDHNHMELITDYISNTRRINKITPNNL